MWLFNLFKKKKKTEVVTEPVAEQLYGDSSNATTYTNLGPIYTTTEKYEAMKTAGTLEVGREYKIVDWEAQAKLTAGTNIDITNNVISATIQNASSTTAGITKLYTATGTNTDGTMDQNSITTELGAKVDSNAVIIGNTKCKITYDSKGLVTAGANLEATDIPSLGLSKISDVTATAEEVNILDGITATTTELNYTDGVTSNIQTQLDNKESTSNKVTSVSSSSTDTQYPSAKCVYTGLAGKQDTITTLSKTLNATDWSNNTQTISVTGVTASNTILVSPAPASVIEYGNCGVYCSAQAVGTLTFVCSNTPTNNLAINVIII